MRSDGSLAGMLGTAVHRARSRKVFLSLSWSFRLFEGGRQCEFPVLMGRSVKQSAGEVKTREETPYEGLQLVAGCRRAALWRGLRKCVCWRSQKDGAGC